MRVRREKGEDLPGETAAYDYVVIGAGSAGCVLANRLSADPSVSVALLEAGADTEPFWVRTPAGVGNVFFDERLNWKFSTEPEASLGGRRLYWPRGKIIGGSSAINGMVYIRGVPADYDHWSELGNTGWSWHEVLPYFKRSETNDLGECEFHGSAGPLQVTRPKTQEPITDAFVRAGVAAGLALNEDNGGATMDGVGFLQHTIGKGVRSSSARAFLEPVRHRANLTVVDNAHANRLVIKQGGAAGVVLERRGVETFIRARREVIVSAGAVGSPKLLLLSGIGPSAHLSELGIDVVALLPGVGANLQDHLAVNAVYEVKTGMSLNNELGSWRKFLHGAGYLMSKGGPLAMGSSHAVAFVRSDPDLPTPDIQLSFRPLSFEFNADSKLRMHPYPGVQFASAMLRPTSRGVIKLRSADPHDPPAIHANYLSNPADERTMVETLRWIRKIAASSPLKESIVREDFPGEEVQSEQQVVDFVRKYSQTLYHPVGTCKMGSDSHAVVDSRLRVHGVKNLRVIDASIMPTIVSGNTNAAAIMIGEKGADMILEDAVNEVDGPCRLLNSTP